MSRQLVPEILDQLPHDDPDAIRSRGDIQRINALAGSHRWAERTLRHLKPQHLVEVGAGCGTLLKRLAHSQPDCRFTAIDLIPRPTDLPSSIHWIQGDALEKIPKDGDVLLANLFLHHLNDGQLAQLGGKLHGYRALVCCEPARSNGNHYLGYLARLLGINYVTRFDLHASIDAGFRDQELPQSMGLKDLEWNVRTEQTHFGIYRMVATRTP